MYICILSILCQVNTIRHDHTVQSKGQTAVQASTAEPVYTENNHTIIKKRRTADDVTKILMTLKLKFPITLTEKHF
jgi:hypothetical protein